MRYFGFCEVFLRAGLVVCILMFAQVPKAQINQIKDSLAETMLWMSPRVVKVQDSFYLIGSICKTAFRIPVSKARMLVNESLGKLTYKEKTPFLAVHGNIQYDYLYRSFADTPFYQKDFQQHTLQTSLIVTVKDKYPLRVNLVLRKSNSPYFKDFFDGGVVFDQHSYQNKMKAQIAQRINREITGQSYLKSAEELLEKEKEKLNALKIELNSPDILQQIIEQRERLYFRSKQSSDLAFTEKNSADTSVLYSDFVKQIDKKLKDSDIDSLADNFLAKVDRKQKQFDSLQHKINSLQTRVDSIKNKIDKEVSSVNRMVTQARNSNELSQILAEYGLEEKRSKGEKLAANLKTVGIGRTLLNYSELTASNVSLSGLNIEYNPKLYFALAAGKIDYGFRDFLGRQQKQRDQKLLMGRFGVGDVGKKAIIFSLFTGRKNNYQNAYRDSSSSLINIVGYSVETILRKNANTFLSVEVAKTTKPLTGTFTNNEGLKNLVQFGDDDNMGVSVKGETELSQSETKLSGFFRKTGESFQSFSLFSYNTDQTAWLLRIDQHLFKKRIGLTGMLRRNDFVNPFAQQTFKTSTVFKSFQVNVRLPKWPVLSAGYYPGSQIYIVDGRKAIENAYYIFNGSIVHSYMVGSTQMLSSLIYNRYYNKGTDSGFIVYKGTSYLASQSLILGKLQLQGQYIYTDQERMKFYTLDANLDYTFSSLFQLGAGSKYNKVLVGGTYWGAQAKLQSTIGKLGTLQFQYEKSYLPTIHQTLFPVEVGRISWLKTF